MAGKGGYQRPKESASYSGVGKNSRRTDGGKQAVKSPSVQDSTDLTQGDRQRIEQGQRVAPLSRTPAPQVQAPAPGSSPTGAGGGPAQLPPHLFGGESTRPDEPITEGLPFGPGAGPEILPQPAPQTDQEIVLQWLVDNFQDDAAFQMLNEIRTPAPQASPAASALPEIDDLDDDEALGMEDNLSLPEEDLATEEEVAVEGAEDLPEPSVETPEAATSAVGGEPSATSPTSAAD